MTDSAPNCGAVSFTRERKMRNRFKFGAVGCFILGAVFAGAGCKQGASSPSDAPASGTAQATEATGLETITAEGTRFDPPLPASRIPENTWICDMDGRVHYAAKEKGNGRCPICSMHLVHKDASGSSDPGGSR